MDCTRKSFLGGGAAAFFVAAGLGHRVMGGTASKARLRVGILSDIHIVNGAKNYDSNAGSSATFEKALAYFRDQGADAVVIAGDMADNGLESQLMQLGNAWRKVFPGGCFSMFPKRRPVFAFASSALIYLVPGSFSTCVVIRRKP